MHEFVSSGLRDRMPESVMQFDPLMQNRLVNWVFQQQVKLRQKGLL
jgi:hypothetical protein